MAWRRQYERYRGTSLECTREVDICDQARQVDIMKEERVDNGKGLIYRG